MAAFADVQRAWELHWSTVIAIDDSERADASSSYTQVKYGATLDQAVREKGKAMAICTEALQQLQEAQRIQRSTKQADTPMQLMQQYTIQRRLWLLDRQQKAQREDQSERVRRIDRRGSKQALRNGGGAQKVLQESVRVQSQ